MEHGNVNDQSKATFSFVDEDHTLANAIRFTLNQDIPHPSEARLNIQVQTTGEHAREVLKDECENLMLMCQHVRKTFNQAVADSNVGNPIKTKKNAAADINGSNSMETDSDSE